MDLTNFTKEKKLRVYRHQLIISARNWKRFSAKWKKIRHTMSETAGSLLKTLRMQLFQLDTKWFLYMQHRSSQILQQRSASKLSRKVKKRWQRIKPNTFLTQKEFINAVQSYFQYEDHNKQILTWEITFPVFRSWKIWRTPVQSPVLQEIRRRHYHRNSRE